MAQNGTSWNTRDQCLHQLMKDCLLKSSSFMMVSVFFIIIVPHTFVMRLNCKILDSDLCCRAPDIDLCSDS
jgi:hypothetical protein